jgi:ribosomal protein S27AE/preprotein translocase subunit YajC
MKQGRTGEAPKIARSPSSDQKKVRRQMAQKTAGAGEMGEVIDLVPGLTTIASRPGYSAGYERGQRFADSFISSDAVHPWNAMPTLRTRIAAHHMPQGLRTEAAGAFIAGFVEGVQQARTATVLKTHVERLQPGDAIVTPTGQTVKVKKVRNHETQGDHVYLDTDAGTSLVKRQTEFSISPHNTIQQEVPGFGVPGANTNANPYGRDHGQTNQVSSGDCPNCGAKGSMSRRGGTYVCSRCGYHEQTGPLGPDATLMDSDRVIKTFTSLDRKSAIARRAHEVLNPLEEQ